ncbi:MAG: hypothetical protein H8M99_13865 [Gloeobacteraceae cyanobacterium ES-bin-144]|nr:hypothetical protein [Verrucomicrobiales bacterium]
MQQQEAARSEKVAITSAEMKRIMEWMRVGFIGLMIRIETRFNWDYLEGTTYAGMLVAWAALLLHETADSAEAAAIKTNFI